MVAVSEKPWSDYKASDYSLEQWHASCLIHMHEGSGEYTKSDCKLPVKTPDGTINRNGVHAAAAALAGARGGVNASPEQKASAARALKSLYSKLDEDPPDSLKQSALGIGEEFIQHYGVKGMKWGVRNKRRSSKKGGKPSGRTTYKKTPNRLSDDELKRRISRMELEKKYSDLNTPPKAAGKQYAKGLLENSGRTVVGTTVGAVSGFAVQSALKKKFGS